LLIIPVYLISVDAVRQKSGTNGHSQYSYDDKDVELYADRQFDLHFIRLHPGDYYFLMPYGPTVNLRFRGTDIISQSVAGLSFPGTSFFHPVRN
jgi:hypothetical protein